MTTVRLDKWLWAARFFKTRALAARACELGRVRSNGVLGKPARDVRAGDKLNITNETGLFEIEVLALSDVRGPAAVAQALYRESEQSREARAKLVAERKAIAQFEELPVAKPTGRDRRMLSRLRGRG
jgi:ribosome-associated heat shock protein Hsp15